MSEKSVILVKILTATAPQDLAKEVNQLLDKKTEKWDLNGSLVVVPDSGSPTKFKYIQGMKQMAP
jgi:hypothetical protein